MRYRFSMLMAVFAWLMISGSYAQDMPPGNGVVHYPAAGGDYPFSSAVKAGDLVFLSGQIGDGDHGLDADFDTQARLAMTHVFSAAALAGLEPDQIVKCMVMLADMKRWDAFNEVYRSYFKPGRYPARSAFAVAGLAFGAAVEVECVGYAAPAAPAAFSVIH